MTAGTNPKDKVARAKPRISQLPLAPLMEVWTALFEGARKYSPWNWRFQRVNEMVYIDAAVGHLLNARCGEKIDPDSGLSHVTKAIAGLLILRDAQMHGTSIDDCVILQDLPTKAMANLAAELTERYPQVAGPIDDVQLGHPTRGISDSDGPESFDDADDAIFRTAAAARAMVPDEWVAERPNREAAVQALNNSAQCAFQLKKAVEYHELAAAAEKRAAELAKPVAKWSCTEAGNGSYELSSDDVGKSIVLRDGREGKITGVANEESSTWPVEFDYAYDDEYDEDDAESDSCRFNGFTYCSGTQSNNDNDIVKVLHN